MLEERLRLIDKLDGRINAFVELARDSARRDAEESAQRWRTGAEQSPIDGILVGVKDIIETADMPTAQGSPLWTGFSTLRDSATVQALREAGAVILGKTATTEFACTELLAKTVNPHDPDRTPGGSSSGSAAAVGAGLIPVALGSQVVGSTLRPSSYCGCFGFKPTTGALNRGGSYDYLSQSCVGLMGATLEDVWLCAKAIAVRVGGDPGNPGLQGPDMLPTVRAPKRLLLLETEGWHKATPGAKEALAGEMRRIREQGLEIVSRSSNPKLNAFEDSIADALDLTWEIMCWEFRWPLGTYARRDAGAITPAMLSRLKQGEEMTQADYAAALARRSSIRAAFQDLAADFDGVVTLAATGAAPVGFASTGNPSFNVPASLLGAPAISLPILSDEGLPLGLQLVALQGHDADLFALARWFTVDR
jgi:Asp-tRNA(Asn)/Glu-tRNA(Gln) amidotransferase A subunit family amidase